MTRPLPVRRRNWPAIVLMVLAGAVMVWAVSDQSRHPYWIWAAALQITALIAVLREGTQQLRHGVHRRL
jgi:hypothetical protein